MKKIVNFSSKAKSLGLRLDEIKEIENILEKNGGKLLLVGGNVRDLIQGKKISSSIDLVTNINVTNLIKILKSWKIRFIETGVNFGTITIILNQCRIELTSMRKDIETDGRWAKVEFTQKVIEDSKRRDFTINSIYCDARGNLIDNHDGVADLKRGIVRFIGDPETRIKEDYLRILRFFRFSLMYSKRYDKLGLEACKKNIKKISLLSLERRLFELEKILLLQKFIKKSTYKMLNDFIEKALGNKVNSERFEELCKVEKSLNIESFERRIKYLYRKKRKKSSLIFINKIDKGFRRRLSEKINFKNFLNDEIFEKLYFHPKKNIVDQLIFEFIEKKITRKTFLNLYLIVNEFKPKQIPINGKDLIELGFKENPKLGEILTATKKWWVRNGCKKNKYECLKFIKSISP